jgi:uncharacterized protein YndB with AHSA1/START domain
MQPAPIVVEKTYRATPERIWQALTSKEEMKQWYFDIQSFKPEVGFEFSFEGGAEDRVYVHRCKITEVIPGRKLSYSWRYEGYEGNSLVTFELIPEGVNTRVRITHTGVETFPSSQPDFAKKNFEGGWEEIMGRLLKNHVEQPG